MHSHSHHVQRLERILHQPAQNGRNLKARFNNLWQTAIAHLAISSEPHVWQTQDATGQMVWNSYDPNTGRSIHRVSAAELRVWLEERHYQGPSAYSNI